MEQDADGVMFIYRQRQYEEENDTEGDPVDNTAEIIIRKQRNGPTGTVKLTFLPEYARFESQSDRSVLESVAAMMPAQETNEGEEIPF